MVIGSNSSCNQFNHKYSPDFKDKKHNFFRPLVDKIRLISSLCIYMYMKDKSNKMSRVQ